jgi:CRP-like cAMP-binding protein
MKKEEFNGHSSELPAALKKLGRLMRLQEGEILFTPQEEAPGFYSVLSGEIRVYKMDEQGREVEVVRLGPGGFLGEAIVFVSQVFTVFAQAVRDSHLLYFDKKEILKEMDSDPDLAKFFIELLAKKCVVLSERIESLELRTVRQRLIQYLLANCSGNKKCLVELKIKKTDLAKILGTISETLSRNLKQMQDEGLIEVKGNNIFIKNCPSIRDELAC